MLKKINTRARPRIFKPAMSKSRWKSNLCVAMAVFLLLMSVSLLHTKLGAEGTDSQENENSVHVSKFPSARKQLINKDRETLVNGKGRVLDKDEALEIFNTRFAENDANENMERRENLEVNNEGEEESLEEEEDDDAGDNEMEDFDGFQDKIDELDEMDEREVETENFRSGQEKEGKGDNFSERSLSGGESHVKDLDKQGAENGSQENIENSKGEKFSRTGEDNGSSGKRLERLGQIKTLTLLNSSQEQKKTRDDIQLKEMGAQKIKSLRGRAGLFWDHVMGVTRRAFLKHPQRLVPGTDSGKTQIEREQESDIDIQFNEDWEHTTGDDLVAGDDDRIKEAFSSDDEPIDEAIRNGLEEVYAIEDALLLKGSDRSSPLRSGWGPWFETIQRRASKSDFLRRDRMARSTVDLLNPMNNPLLQDPDAIGPAILTKSDRAIQKSLKKASIEGVPFVGEQSIHSKEVSEEETGVEGKDQVQDSVTFQKALEESNLDGGDEASVKERSNPDNDDDASIKTGLTQLTRKALDESDRTMAHVENKVGNKNSEYFTDTRRKTEQIQSVMPEQVIERKKLPVESSKYTIKTLGKISGRSKKDTHRSNSRRNKVPFKKQGAESKDDSARRLRSLSASELKEYKLQDSAKGTLSTQVNSLRVHSRIVDNKRDVFPSDHMTEDGGDTMESEMIKTTGVEKFERTQRPGEPIKLSSAYQKKIHKKIHLNGDTQRWGYFPGLDPLLSFADFMNEFLQDGNCSLRVFMAWTTPPWSYSVRYQRGLESLLYFHPHACVVVFSDSIELDFFNDFVKDGYRVAVVMPNLDELLVNTPAHIFASVWLDWRKVDLYYIHYTELLRLAALYKYGGVYLDSDTIVLKALDSLNNTLGAESPNNEEITLNGAVMAFEKHSLFLLECLTEFTATYDDTLLRWNGAELLTRVAKRSIERSGESWVHKDFKIQPYWAFFPLSFHNIKSYFTTPDNQYDKEMQEVLFNRILNVSTTLHFYNNVTSKLVPESGSLVERVLNYHCLHCTDFL